MRTEKGVSVSNNNETSSFCVNAEEINGRICEESLGQEMKH